MCAFWDHAQIWSFSLTWITTAEARYNPQTQWRAEEGTWESPALLHKSEKASHGRLHTKWLLCGNSLPQDPKTTQTSKTQGETEQAICSGLLIHRSLPRSVSLWARNWYSTLGKWCCNLGSNLRFVLKCHPQRLGNRQAGLQLSLQHKTSAAPGHFACVGCHWHNHSNTGLINHLSPALFPHPTL